MAGPEIQINTQNCTGCLRCQLACSFQNTGRFNPSAAYLTVQVRGPECEIVFTEECLDCGVCADSCFYEALVKVEGAPQ